MKVLHVIPSISSKRGGPSQAILDMVKALRMQGVEASIVCTTDNSMYSEDKFVVGQWFIYQGIPILMFPCLDSSFKLLREFLFSPSLSFWLIRHIRDYDILHIHAIFSYPSTFAMFLARMMRVPYIVRTIGQLNQWSLNQSKLRKILMLNLIEKANLMHSAAIHVTSKSEMEDIKQLNMQNRIFLQGLGVNFLECTPSTPPRFDRVTRFVFLSRLHPKKQLELLLDALSILKFKCKRDKWFLHIAGDGDADYVWSLKNRAFHLGLQNNVEWMGHITGENKYRLLKESDWYILPSASENFGISVVEALAAGVPVIISDQVGIADIVNEHGAGIVFSSNATTLSQILNHAMDGPSYFMKEAAKTLVKENFLWSVIAQRMSVFYVQCLNPH